MGVGLGEHIKLEVVWHPQGLLTECSYLYIKLASTYRFYILILVSKRIEFFMAGDGGWQWQ